MLKVTNCDLCDGVVDPGDVYRTSAVKSMPGYVALIWSCQWCGAQGRTAARGEDWEIVRESYDLRSEFIDSAVVEMQFDLSMVDNVWDALQLWASYPGPVTIEPRVGKHCGCRACTERLYG